MSIDIVRMYRDDLTVIRASAKRIGELAAQLSGKAQNDFQVEAATIILLIDNQLQKGVRHEESESQESH